MTEDKRVEDETAKRIQEMVARRVEEELEKRRDEIEAEVSIPPPLFLIDFFIK